MRNATKLDLAEGVAVCTIFALSRAGVFSAIRKHTDLVDEAVGSLSERFVGRAEPSTNLK